MFFSSKIKEQPWKIIFCRRLQGRVQGEILFMTSHSGWTGFMNNWIEEKGWYLERAFKGANLLYQIRVKYYWVYYEYMWQRIHKIAKFAVQNVFTKTSVAKLWYCVWITENWSFPYTLEKWTTFPTSPQSKCLNTNM